MVMVISCGRDEPEITSDPYLESYADVEECLSFPPLKGSQPAQNQSCINYDYDGDSVLEIIHYNSAFNCCPEEVLTSFHLSNDTIYIAEDDAKELCRCNCLFNVEMTIHNLKPGQYVLVIDEIYVEDKDQLMIFDIDLKKKPAGQFCKFRDFYPWHE